MFKEFHESNISLRQNTLFQIFNRYMREICDYGHCQIFFAGNGEAREHYSKPSKEIYSIRTFNFSLSVNLRFRLYLSVQDRGHRITQMIQRGVHTYV